MVATQAPAASETASSMMSYNSIADEIIERARAAFELQLAEARVGIMCELVSNGRDAELFLDCHVCLDAAYDSKLDLVVVNDRSNFYYNDEESDSESEGSKDCDCCSFCGESREEEVAAEPTAATAGPTCDFPKSPPMESMPQPARLHEAASETFTAAVGEDTESEWVAKNRELLAASETFSQGVKNDADINNNLERCLAVYNYLVESPVTLEALRDYPDYRHVSMKKADQIRAVCVSWLEHMSNPYTFYAHFTAEEKQHRRTLINKLYDVCDKYKALKY